VPSKGGYTNIPVLEISLDLDVRWPKKFRTFTLAQWVSPSYLPTVFQDLQVPDKELQSLAGRLFSAPASRLYDLIPNTISLACRMTSSSSVAPRENISFCELFTYGTELVVFVATGYASVTLYSDSGPSTIDLQEGQGVRLHNTVTHRFTCTDNTNLLIFACSQRSDCDVPRGTFMVLGRHVVMPLDSWANDPRMQMQNCLEGKEGQMTTCRKMSLLEFPKGAVRTSNESLANCMFKWDDESGMVRQLAPKIISIFNDDVKKGFGRPFHHTKGNLKDTSVKIIYRLGETRQFPGRGEYDSDETPEENYIRTATKDLKIFLEKIITEVRSGYAASCGKPLPDALFDPALLMTYSDLGEHADEVGDGPGGDGPGDVIAVVGLGGPNAIVGMSFHDEDPTVPDKSTTYSFLHRPNQTYVLQGKARYFMLHEIDIPATSTLSTPRVTVSTLICGDLNILPTNHFMLTAGVAIWGALHPNGKEFLDFLATEV
jgi:hypothetical protein